MKATSAHIQGTRAVAVANSRLWDIGGFQIPVEVAEGMWYCEVEPQTGCGFGAVAWPVFELSARRMDLYCARLMPLADKGKFATLARLKYIKGDTWIEIQKRATMLAMNAEAM
jgi:hypothetical protein